MTAFPSSDPRYLRTAGVCAFISTVGLWPTDFSWANAFAITVFSALLFTLVLVEIAPWAYRWVVAGVAVPLAYAATATIAWTWGGEVQSILISTAILGSAFSAIAFFVARRR